MRTKRPTTPPTEFTEQWLNDACLEWQTTLRLLDWCVIVRFARRHELGDADGDCDAQVNLKRARIRIVCEGDFVSDFEPYNPTQILIHELLHLHLILVTPNDWSSPAGIALEQAIDLIAGALDRAKRGQ